MAFAVAVFLATACGASAGVELSDAADSATGQSNEDTSTAESVAPESEPSPAVSNDQSTTDNSADEDEEPAEEPASAPRIGQGAFELVLENGDSFSAPINCVLEPQIAAGSEILFTAGGQHDGRFYDITQWGETAFGGTQDVEIGDATTFDVLWRATGSTGLELELNGNVISGSGGFYQGEQFNGPYTQGEITVTC